MARKKNIFISRYVVVAKNNAENSLEVRQTRLKLDSALFYNRF
jgi:hypothetical protein